MQIRSSGLEIRLAPVDLDPAFPIRGGHRSVQKDHPIQHLHIHQCLEIGVCYSGSGIFMGACALSEATLRRLFHSAMGRSPHEYLTDFRLRMAAAMLRTTARTILEISQEAGFPTLSSFNRVFRRSFGRAPKFWRNEERE